MAGYIGSKAVLLSTTAATVTGDMTVDTSTLKVDSTNNKVGIGTASPVSDANLTISSDNSESNIFFQRSGSGRYDTAIVNSSGSILLKGGANATTVAGLTTWMKIDGDTGAVIKPLQPAFFARSGSNSSAYSINGWHTIAFVTERFDNNADFSSPNFTAPITGRYQLNVNIRVSDLDNDADYYQLKLVTSNYNYYFALIDPGRWSGTLNYYSVAVSVLADMDTSDTAYVQIYQGAGAQQTYTNDNDCHFSGYLVA